MKIIVLVKQVPDSTEIRVDKVTGALIREGVPTIINPDDLAGVEEALKIKETRDDEEFIRKYNKNPRVYEKK